MEINERIRFLRKEKLHLTQEALGEPLGLTRANIANIEAGRISVTERVIISICEKFDINEDWLRTGKGDPQKKKTRNQEIAAFMNDIMELPDENRKKRFIEGFSKLTVDDWENILNIIEKLQS